MTTTDRPTILREVKEALGSVPDFLSRIPDPHLATMWQSMRDLQLEEGALPPKYQQLVMLAVSTYAKCRYCTDYHAEAARALGASEAEITEVALLTGHTASLSNYVGGTQQDFEHFKREVRTVFDAVTARRQSPERTSKRSETTSAPSHFGRG